MRTLDGIEDGTLEAREQPDEGVSLAPKITVDDAQVDWQQPAVAVDRRIRACTPGARRVDDVRRRAAQARPGPARRRRRPARRAVLAVSKNAVHVGTGTGRGPAR